LTDAIPLVDRLLNRAAEWTLGDIEEALYELRANIGILGHLAMA
jgi:hypothetical protein